MATYSASKNSVDLAIDPLITCKLCLAEHPLQDMYELYECKCLYCLAVSLVIFLLRRFMAFYTNLPYAPSSPPTKRQKLSAKRNWSRVTCSTLSVLTNTHQKPPKHNNPSDLLTTTQSLNPYLSVELFHSVQLDCFLYICLSNISCVAQE